MENETETGTELVTETLVVTTVTPTAVVVSAPRRLVAEVVPELM